MRSLNGVRRSCDINLLAQCGFMGSPHSAKLQTPACTAVTRKGRLVVYLKAILCRLFTFAMSKSLEGCHHEHEAHLFEGCRWTPCTIRVSVIRYGVFVRITVRLTSGAPRTCGVSLTRELGSGAPEMVTRSSDDSQGTRPR